MGTIQILEEADKEFQEAANWYEDKSEGLGLRFIEVIKIKLEVIQRNPERNPKRKGNFRESVVRTFPYVFILFIKKKI